MANEKFLAKDTVRWKDDDSNGSIWTETIKNHLVQYVIEYQKYDDVYMVLIRIDDCTYEDTSFATMELAKMFCFGFSTWFYDWLELVREKMNNILSD